MVEEEFNFTGWVDTNGSYVGSFVGAMASNEQDFMAMVAVVEERLKVEEESMEIKDTV